VRCGDFYAPLGRVARLQTSINSNTIAGSPERALEILPAAEPGAAASAPAPADGQCKSDRTWSDGIVVAPSRRYAAKFGRFQRDGIDDQKVRAPQRRSGRRSNLQLRESALCATAVTSLAHRPAQQTLPAAPHPASEPSFGSMVEARLRRLRTFHFARRPAAMPRQRTRISQTALVVPRQSSGSNYQATTGRNNQLRVVLDNQPTPCAERRERDSRSATIMRRPYGNCHLRDIPADALNRRG
jgi:hypothetical protein